MAKIEIPSADFNVELAQGVVKAAIAAAGAKTREILMVPVDQIKIVAGFNVRIHDAEYEDHIESIKNSIIENGFYPHKPLSGYAGKEGDQTFIYCTGGFSRLAAAKLAIEAGAPITALPLVLSPAGTSMLDLTIEMAVDNDGKQLRPYERAILIKRAVGYGGDEAAIAKKMGISGQYVTDLLYLLGLPHTVQQMVIKGQVSAGHAVVVARKHGADATKVLQAATGEAESGENGAAAPNGTGKATPSRTGGAGGKTAIPKKVYIAAIVYALALPDGLEFLARWHKGETDAIKELASTMGKKPKAKPKAKAKGAKKGKGGRPTNAAKAAAAAAEPASEVPDDTPL